MSVGVRSSRARVSAWRYSTSPLWMASLNGLIADVLLPGRLWRSDRTGLGFAYAFGIQPLIHMSFCPDKLILAGFSGSFAPCPVSVLAGRHDGRYIPDATASQHPTSCNEGRKWSLEKWRVSRRDERLSRPLGDLAICT